MSLLRKFKLFDDNDRDLLLTENSNVPIEVKNNDGEAVSVQYPFPTNGDSIYVKDIDLSNSDNGNFSGSITDYFNSLKSINSDTTGNNPKIIKLWFNRTVYSHGIGFGCDDLAKGFGSSITIKLLGSGEAIRFTKTYVPTGPNSFVAEFGPKAFNGVILEFNTATEVALSNLTIAKSLEVNATLNGLDPNGDIQSVNVTEDGDLTISNNSSGLSIAEGNVSGKSFIHKFGNAPDFDTTDSVITIWDGADDAAIDQMNYVYSTTDNIDSISSSSAADTQDIEISGLDINYEEVTQTITLTGQALVALPTSLLRVFRMANVSASDNLGHIYCYVNGTITGGVPDVSSDVRAVMQPLNNQTLMALYTVPLNKTAYLRDWFASTAGGNKNSAYVIDLRSRFVNGVFQLKHRSSLSDSGTSYIQHKYDEPEVFTEKTDIEMRVESIASPAAVEISVSAGFDIVLKDN
jgi:hypothetical protein